MLIHCPGRLTLSDHQHTHTIQYLEAPNTVCGTSTHTQLELGQWR